MKKLLLALFLMPMMALGQEKNIVNTVRIFPKLDKTVEFEKALANHHQKFHTGTFKATVFNVLTGPDAGAYHITMGPISWEDLDNRKPTAEHDADWDTKVLPLVNKISGVGFSAYDSKLSTIAVGDFVEKITIFHIFPKEGKGGAVGSILKRAKPSWEINNRSVAVYTSESSGENQFALVTRHKNGWKEKGEKPAKSLKEVLGDAEFEDLMNDVSANIKKTYSEMLQMKKSLGSN